MVEIHGAETDTPLTVEEIEALVCAALRHGGRPGVDLSVALVDDASLAELHLRFLGDPSETDVIAFDLGDVGAGPVGEVYVSVERARKVARLRSREARHELALYVVHGVLHLCGFDDHEAGDREDMRAAERCVLSSLGYQIDTLPHDLDLN